MSLADAISALATRSAQEIKAVRSEMAAGGNPAAVMATVNHGSVASTARPVGALAVYWIGTVTPTNAVDGDMWWSP